MVNQTIPSTIQGFWHGSPLPPLLWACLKSFLKCGHNFDLYSYQPLAVPSGVCLRNAESIIPKEKLFFFQNGFTGQPDVAPFADYFRLKLLQQRGGWWCDVDTIALASQLPAADCVWARQAPEYRPDSVSNGQLFFTQKHPVIDILINSAELEIGKLPSREALGPELFSRTIAELGLPLDMNATAAQFYPIRYIEIFKIWLPEFIDEVEDRLTSAVFLPLYQSFPLRIGLGFDKGPPKGSYLDRFMQENVSDLTWIPHDAADFRRKVKNWLFSNAEWTLPRLRAVSSTTIDDWLLDNGTNL